MSKYQDWFRKQPEEFQKLITINPEKVKENFIDEKYQSITLDELKQLDEQYIFNQDDTDQ